LSLLQAIRPAIRIRPAVAQFEKAGFCRNRELGEMKAGIRKATLDREIIS
jgi:hypothetical protein